MSPPDYLEHEDPDCTGEWRQLGARGRGTWRCDTCGKVHASTPNNDEAADLEFVRGVQLRSQTRQGRFPDVFRRGASPPTIELEDDDGVH